MPFKSQKQMRKFFVLEDEGKLPKGTTHDWLRETPAPSKLPEHVKPKKPKRPKGPKY